MERRVARSDPGLTNWPAKNLSCRSALALAALAAWVPGVGEQKLAKLSAAIAGLVLLVCRQWMCAGVSGPGKQPFF